MIKINGKSRLTKAYNTIEVKCLHLYLEQLNTNQQS